MTIWIPILFVCLVGGGCEFTQGQAGYTERACLIQIETISVRLQAEPMVSAFSGVCFSFTGT
jgi:hypothetical protein